MNVFREAAYRRWGRQASTLARAARAARSRAKPDPRRAVVPVDGEAIRDLAAAVAAARAATRWAGGHQSATEQSFGAPRRASHLPRWACSQAATCAGGSARTR